MFASKYFIGIFGSVRYFIASTHLRIEEGLQIRPFDQQRLVALPAFAVN
jgi:hypothetical protein